MTMNTKEFEEMPDSATLKDTILAILKKDPDHAYSTIDLAKATGTEGSITGATRALADNDVVTRKRIRGMIYVALKQKASK